MIGCATPQGNRSFSAMFRHISAKFALHTKRLFGVAALRRLARREDGAATVEFALVAAPFLALLFAIIETAVVFFAGQTLEAAVAASSRLIMTGQAQTSGYTQAQFKNAVCASVV